MRHSRQRVCSFQPDETTSSLKLSRLFLVCYKTWATKRAASCYSWANDRRVTQAWRTPRNGLGTVQPVTQNHGKRRNSDRLSLPDDCLWQETVLCEENLAVYRSGQPRTSHPHLGRRTMPSPFFELFDVAWFLRARQWSYAQCQPFASATRCVSWHRFELGSETSLCCICVSTV